MRGSLRALAAFVFAAVSASAVEFPAAEWPRAEPRSQGVDPALLRHALEGWRAATGKHGTDRAVIVRRGAVIYEGPQAGRPQNLWSATKSFTSTVLGLLIAEKKVALDTRAAAIEPLLRARYPAVTLRHFATMTSGYSAPGSTRWNEVSEDWSREPYVPGPPLFAPGTRYAYWDEAQMMFGRVLTRAAGADLLEYLGRRVFEPIGMRVRGWDLEGEVDGIPIRNGCTGIRVDALNLARFGHLFLNEGRWAGRQLVPAEWVRAATRPQVPADLPLADTDRRSIDGRGVYGFNWWVLPGAPVRAYYAAGLNHNICLVIPAWEMAIVRLGEDGNPPAGHAAVLRELLARLAPALAKD